MIYLGENQITGIKLGNSDISSIYVGENKAYPIVEKCSNCVVMTAAASQTVTPPTGKTFEYSYDSYYWSAVTGSISFGDANGRKSVYIRGKNESGINAKFAFGNNSSLITLSGNCMSLLDWENPSLDTVPSSGFSILFCGATVIESVSEDFLPATNLSNYCYHKMFCECLSLVNTPKLPALEVSVDSYDNMFSVCLSLTDVRPILATKVGIYSCYQMFDNCRALKTAPTLNVTVLAPECYYAMFQNCTSLINPPTLPVETLERYCYDSMFAGCTSLINAPSLPSKTLDRACYTCMFSGCTSLINAPLLPAKELADWCYLYMFQGCSSLKEIHVSATDNTSSLCTGNWLDNVGENGVFYCNSNCTWGDGVSGIPTGWTKRYFTD